MMAGFVHAHTVRFFEVDAAGIAYFGKVLDYCHAAYEELLLAAGFGIRTLADVYHVIMPIVHTEADFRRPLRLHDRIHINVVVERSSGRSITFYYVVANVDDEVHATARTVHAFVDSQTFLPRNALKPLTDALRARGAYADSGDAS